MFEKLISKMGFTKEETSWILYDVANSEQVLMTMTVLFPLLMGYISKENGSTYVGWANTIYATILAFLSPIMGTYADYKGKKKKLFKFFLTLGIIAGFALALPFINAITASIIFVFAMLGYAGANIFYDAFLIDVTTDERMNKVSAAGYGWGYIGSTFPFIIFIIPFALTTLFGNADGNVVIMGFTLTYRMSISISMSLAVIWWLWFSFPILKNVEQKHYHEPSKHPVKDSFIRLKETFKHIRQHRNVFLFCLAYFFYIDAVNSVISMAVALVTDMGVSDVVSLIVIIMIQLIAFPGTIIYGKLADKYSGKPMIYMGIFAYLIIILVGSQIARNTNLIWVLGILVGCFQGGIQSVSRSYFASLIPDKEDSNEFFGFFSIFSKFSAILGPLAISVVVTITKNPSFGILGLVPSMIIGSIILFFVKSPEKQK